MKIVALIDGTKAPSNWGMGIPTYELHFADQFDSQVFIKLAPGADAAAFERQADAILSDYPTAELQTPDEFKASAASQINQIVQIIYAMLFLAIIIALLGIANTLALSIYERRHEIGLLRAVGMTRSQVRSSVRWEAVIIALLGTALGLDHRHRVRRGDRPLTAIDRLHRIRDPDRSAGHRGDPRRGSRASSRRSSPHARPQSSTSSRRSRPSDGGRVLRHAAWRRSSGSRTVPMS